MSRRAVWFAVVLCNLAMMSVAIAINLLPLFLASLSHDLASPQGFTAEQLGRVGSITYLGVVIGMLLTGPLADQLGARVSTIGGELGIAAGFGLLFTAQSYEGVLASVALLGFGNGLLAVLSPIVSALRPERRTGAMNLLHSFYCIGAMAAILIASLAMRAGISWRTISLAALPIPLGLGVCFLLVPSLPLCAAGRERTSLPTVLRHRFFVIALVALFLCGATEVSMAYWLPLYAEKSLGYSAWVAGVALFCFSLMMAVGRLTLAFLPHRIDPIRLMLGCSAALVALFLFAAFAPFNSVRLSSCVLIGLAGSCLWPSTLAIAADRFQHGGATPLALLELFGNAGGILLPWSIGAIADASSLRWGIASAAFCPLFLLAPLLLLRSGNANESELLEIKDAPIV